MTRPCRSIPQVPRARFVHLLRSAGLIMVLTVQALQAAEASANPAATPAGAPHISPWGFTSSAEWFGEYPRFNALMAKAGICALRAFPEWSTLEPKPGEWNWKPADALVADARANHIQLSGGFWYFAPWATPKGDTRSAPLKDISSWSTYVGATVSRFGNDIRDWEVYNEFNGSFSNSANKPKDYADLMVAASTAAKKANPHARVGMSCANFDLGFFDSAIKAGAGGTFDFICVHPYENLGALATGGEDGFLSMASSMRKLLADNKQRSDISLWITEFGLQSTVMPNPEQDLLQADVLVKGYVLALAQGFERICWFEARGPSYGHGTDFGVIRQDWTLRPSYQAMTVMTGLLGDQPTYLGWLNLADGGYGFIFQPTDATQRPVLCAWSSKGPLRTVIFPTDVTVTTIAGVINPQTAGQPVHLGLSPVYITGMPKPLVAMAIENAAKPFPWGGDYAHVASVSCGLGATNTDHGITQVNPQTMAVVNLLDHTLRRSNRAGGSEGIYGYFRVDPLFATFGTKELSITVVARRVSGQSSGMDICYESLKGYKGTGQRWEVPAGEAWSEHTWTVDNANFVGGWGWNFRTDIGGSPGDVYIKEVRVAKPGSASPPAAH